jgi:hypothetical protein
MEALMMIRSTMVALGLVAAPTVVVAQHGDRGAGAPIHAPPKEASQFDFLIGQWDLSVRPKVAGLAAKIHGAPRLLGTWKAWRAFDGFGIEDELRIVDGSGNPNALNHALRAYDPTARRWNITGVDVYRGRVTSATAEWQDGAMAQSGKGTDAEGKPYLTRTRFTAITPSSFVMQQDRSADDGNTWDEAVLKIEAKRVAATAPR